MIQISIISVLFARVPGRPAQRNGPHMPHLRSGLSRKLCKSHCGERSPAVRFTKSWPGDALRERSSPPGLLMKKRTSYGRAAPRFCLEYNLQSCTTHVARHPYHYQGSISARRLAAHPSDALRDIGRTMILGTNPLAPTPPTPVQAAIYLRLPPELYFARTHYP